MENPSKSEVIGRLAGMKKTNNHAEPTKSNAKKKTKKNKLCIFCIGINLQLKL